MEKEQGEKSNSCLKKAGKLTFRAMYLLCRCLILSVTLTIEGYFTKVFCLEYVGEALEAEDISSQKRTQILAALCFVIFAQFMSVLCLLRLFLSNPGFVRDYFESRQLATEVGGPSRRFAIFKKGEAPPLQQTDTEAPLLNTASDIATAEKQLCTVTVMKKEDMKGLEPYSVDTSYCFRFCEQCE